MNGYTSGKASHDPEPWVSGHEHHTRYATNGVPPRPSNDEDGWQCSLCVRRYQPRPEYDNHNPILVAFRPQPDIDLWDMGFAMFTTFGGYKDWEKDHHYFRCFTVATDHQIAHARRVLTKYAAVFL